MVSNYKGRPMCGCCCFNRKMASACFFSLMPVGLRHMGREEDIVGDISDKSSFLLWLSPDLPSHKSITCWISHYLPITK